jgi:hypothetical protein
MNEWWMLKWNWSESLLHVRVVAEARSDLYAVRGVPEPVTVRRDIGQIRVWDQTWITEARRGGDARNDRDEDKTDDDSRLHVLPPHELAARCLFVEQSTTRPDGTGHD